MGCVAGSDRPDGYRQISLDGTLYLVGRLAWFYVKGVWPNQIDHKNGLRGDDRWENLRDATHSQNKMNTPIQINNSTGFKGVSFDDRRDKYYSSIKKDNQSFFLGYFDYPEEAHEAYKEAALRLHGEFAQLS